MHRKYLGDSYDAVKRLWQQIFAPWAPLHANERFIPAELRGDFTKLTGIEMANLALTGAYSLLNDPDTGVRLPGKTDQSEGKHVAIATILGQLDQPRVKCVVTFDQSNYRSDGTLKWQRLQKLNALRSEGAHGFYYVSHAPFLFSAGSTANLRKVRARLIAAGVPENRIE